MPFLWTVLILPLLPELKAAGKFFCAKPVLIFCNVAITEYC
jgi:hypothetical protein